MGICSSSSIEGKSQSDAIDRELKESKAEMDEEVKLLLLGAGESGKSTIVKQMKIIAQDGYKSDADRAKFKDVIYSNTMQSMKVLVKACQRLGIPLAEESNQELADALLEMNASGENFNADVAQWIKSLWADNGIRAAFSRRSEFQLNDSASYYFEAIDRVSNPDYLPTTQDVLRSRVRTTGIVDFDFSFGGVKFRMYDVGGQRNERKKWIHCFQGVTAVIFIVGISEYDQKLYEDETQNRMNESLLLFDEICNSRWFLETSMVLFLNKTDLFKDKILKVPLTQCFPDYEGGQEYEPAVEYIKEKFIELNRSDHKEVYPHETCATDTKNIEYVFKAVKDIILKNNLRQSGFL
eukprot:TRINITY_DN810_c0_g2_i1.p1 TRINITY_DN810_c0_g2~~TRINITY_DN810_c0_g2_i1.p1  ORF type:complete len:352 (-),score=119.38 TRINITY_DN810_c0_g2_i1:143-1198(-)